MNRIVERAGLESWEKTFQNLRASRRTELEEQISNHVVNSWIGHSAKVAEKSYLQVTPDHWKAGASELAGDQISGPISVNLGLSSGATKPANHEKTPGRHSLTGVKAPPVGLEPTTNGLTVRCSTN